MFISQKAQEISLALIKISVYIRRAELKGRFELLAFDLLERVAGKDFESALSILDVLRALISFGKTIYEIEPYNVRILLQELDGLSAAIQKELGLNEGFDIDSIFSKPVSSIIERSSIDHSTPGNREGDDYNREDQVSSGNSAIRQSAIVERIRQSGNAAMKDIIAAFPEVSERTLRYDLQKLCFSGAIQRVGNGGPSSYYILGGQDLNQRQI